jgi:N-acetylneuraminic acid mutarotase
MGEQRTALILLLILCFAISTLPLVRASEDSWATKAPMQVARSALGVAAVNGKIYAIGGSNQSGFAPSMPDSTVLGIKHNVDTNEEYDPATNTWTFKKPMPTPRNNFAIAVYQNKIYCIGGYTENGHTGLNEIYDPATDTWETKTSMPTARGWLMANVVDDKIYLIGGYPNTTLNEVYDPATDTWITKTPSPKPTAFTGGYASAVFENKIYVIGGLSEDYSYNLNQIYDTETGTWSFGTSPPSSIDGGAAVATTGNLAPKQIYVLGAPSALRQGEERNFVRVYDPETDNWTFGADVPTKRYNFGVAVINDIFYVIGGHTYDFPGFFAPSAANEQYTPIGYIPEFPSWTILPLLITTILLIIIYKKRLPKKHQNQKKSFILGD